MKDICPVCGDDYHLLEIQTERNELKITGSNCLDVYPSPEDTDHCRPLEFVYTTTESPLRVRKRPNHEFLRRVANSCVSNSHLISYQISNVQADTIT